MYSGYVPAKKERQRFKIAMLDRELIRKVIDIKLERGYTLLDLSRILDLSVSTIERWFKTNRINKVYARLVKEKLAIE